MAARPTASCEARIGRYEIHGELGAGGMASVHFGRLLGSEGFARTVAIKRLHPHYAKLAEFAAMFVDEARLAARVRHPNVVATLDTIAEGGELLLVMEYVTGESLAGLLAACASRGEAVPLPIAVRIAADALYGLHAAHTATGPEAEPLHIVHRDVSPQNILVGADGLARVLDFGIARATTRVHTTKDGQLKGKLRYMAPEQLHDDELTARTDVYAMSVVLWELLTSTRLFAAQTEAGTVAKVLGGVVVKPSRIVPTLPQALDDLVLRGLAREPSARFASAQEMAVALESATTPALPRELGEWVRRVAADVLDARAAYVAAIERGDGSDSVRAAGSEPVLSSRAQEATETLTTGRSPASQATIAAAASAGEPPSKRFRNGLLAVGALVLAVAAFAATRVGRAPSASRVTEERGATPSSASATAPPPATVVEGSSAGTADDAPSSTSTPPRSAPAAKPPVRRKPSSRACHPPYLEDANGIRRVKDGCL